MTATAVVTMTRARDEAESEAALASLTALDALGIPIFASDARSIPAFREAAQRLPQLRSCAAGSSLVGQVKSAMQCAAAEGHRYVFYTEPDKREFFLRGARGFLKAAQEQKGAAIFLAARDEASFSTFPIGQQTTERAVQQVGDVFLERLPDLLYGPLVLDLEWALPYFDTIQDELVWGWRLYLIARAVKSGRAVRGFAGSFPCPVDQRDEDDPSSRLYRIEQARQCLEGIRLGLRDAMSGRSGH
jgi:hypothetical protein